MDLHKGGFFDGTLAKVILTAGAVSGVALAYTLWIRNKKMNAEFKVVGKVSKLFIYPIKSTKGIPMDKGKCQKYGFMSEEIRDREFLIVNETGNFITARQEPTLVLVTPRIEGATLYLDGPGMATLKVRKPLDTGTKDGKTGQPIHCRIFGENVVGLDCGQDAQDWLSKYLNKDGVRLVHFPKKDSTRIPAYYKEYGFKKTDNSIFADLTPYMLLSDASVDDLNTRLTNKISIKNFRPNIGVEGCGAYEEETWKLVKIGDVVFRNVKPCTRCVLTTVDPETGIKDGIEPLRTLKTYRQLKEAKYRKLEGESPVFGVHLVADRFGDIKVGDLVYATV